MAKLDRQVVAYDFGIAQEIRSYADELCALYEAYPENVPEKIDKVIKKELRILIKDFATNPFRLKREKMK